MSGSDNRWPLRSIVFAQFGRAFLLPAGRLVDLAARVPAIAASGSRNNPNQRRAALALVAVADRVLIKLLRRSLGTPLSVARAHSLLRE